MKTLIPKLMLLSLAIPCNAGDVTVTSPPGGNASAYYPFLVGATRYQQVYSASDFLATAPGGGLINQIAFSPFGSTFDGAEITNINIRFSTTQASPSSLS